MKKPRPEIPRFILRRVPVGERLMDRDVCVAPRCQHLYPIGIFTQQNPEKFVNDVVAARIRPVVFRQIVRRIPTPHHLVREIHHVPRAINGAACQPIDY